MSDTVKIDTSKLDAIIAHLDIAVLDGLTALGFKIQQQAQLAAPRDTGAMSNSIYVDNGKQNGFSEAAANARSANPGVEVAELPRPSGETAVIVGPCVEYAAAVELGHLTKPFTKSQGCRRFVPGRPFLRPAMESVIGDLNSGKFLKDLLK